MTDDESRFARKLIGHLDHGAADVRSGTLYRLQQARAAALARVAPSAETVPVLAPAAAGGAPAGRTGSWGSPGRWLGVALLLAALGFGFQQWQALQQVQEYEELDLHLLASDLPIDAYLDRGFQNWLRTTLEY